VGLRFRPSLKQALGELARRPLVTYIELVLEDHVEDKGGGKPASKRK
jgi:hypothetical protein